VVPVEHQLFSGSAYLVLFAGTVLEGETVLISAGFAAQQGYLSLPMVVFAAWLGAISGDHFFFALGRRRGRSPRGAGSPMPGRLGKVRGLLERYRSCVIVGFRFVYGFRMVAPFAIGAAGVPLGRFFMLNALSGLIWASLFGLAGYFFGAALDAVARDIHTRLVAGAGMLSLIALTAAIAMMRKRSKDKSRTVAL
jgi:membrane protein DedA with SNARE-associated domain